MDVKSVLKLDGELTKFYCETLDIYLRLDIYDDVKSIYVSDTLEDLEDMSCPLLENVLNLEDIFELEVEPIETLMLIDVLKEENIGKTYYTSKLNCGFMCKLDYGSKVPRLFAINPITHMLTDELIEDTYELIDIANAKFVEVN